MNREPTEMELRVAKALWEHEGDDTGMHDSGRYSVENYVSLARAAIRAMRMPTTEMLREAGMGATCSTEDIAFMWETMIDAASPPEEDKP